MWWCTKMDKYEVCSKISFSVSLKNIWSQKKVSLSVSKTFGLEKSPGIGLENIWSQKKSRYQSQKHLVSKKSLGIGHENIWSQKKSRYRSRMKFLVSSLSDNKRGPFWALFWHSLTPLANPVKFCCSKMACTGVPNIVLYVLYPTRTSRGHFRLKSL